MKSVIVRTVISEKSMADANKSKFTFIVANEATKKDIKEAVEKAFKVNVLSVATAVIKGKSKRSGARRIERVATPVKKALVALKAGQKIDAFELGA